MLHFFFIFIVFQQSSFPEGTEDGTVAYKILLSEAASAEKEFLSIVL